MVKSREVPLERLQEIRKERVEGREDIKNLVDEIVYTIWGSRNQMKA